MHRFRLLLSGSLATGCFLLAWSNAGAQKADSQQPAPRAREHRGPPPERREPSFPPEHMTPPHRPAERIDEPSEPPGPGEGVDHPDQPGTPHRPFQHPFRPLSDEERGELLQFLNEHFPERAKDLEALRDFDPPSFDRRIVRIFPRLRQLMMEMRSDPEAGRLGLVTERLEMQIRDSVRQYVDARDAQARAALRTRIRNLLQQQFDVRRQRMEHDIGKLEERLQRLRERMQAQQERREALIDTRLNNLLTEQPGREPDERP